MTSNTSLFLRGRNQDQLRLRAGGCNIPQVLFLLLLPGLPRPLAAEVVVQPDHALSFETLRLVHRREHYRVDLVGEQVLYDADQLRDRALVLRERVDQEHDALAAVFGALGLGVVALRLGALDLAAGARVQLR